MSGRATQGRDPRDTRERLLEAAASLFAERGFRGTGVREIAQRAGANVAAANYHFGSKESLYLAVLRGEFARIRARIEASGARLAGSDERRLPRKRLEEILRSRIVTMFEVLLGPPTAEHARLMMREMLDPSEAQPVIVAEFLRPQIAEVGGILGRIEPGLDRAEIERCVFSLMGQVIFYVFARTPVLLMHGRDEYPRDAAQRLGDHVFRFALGGLARLAADRGKARRRRPAVALSLVAALTLVAAGGCSSVADLTRPAGTGGWSPERRHVELDRAGRAAGVALDGIAAADAIPDEGTPQGRGAGASSLPGSTPRVAAGNAAMSNVAPGVVAPAATGGTLDLPTALRLSGNGNRRIAETSRQLAASAERVMDVRGRLLPATTATARYSWYSDEQQTAVDLPPDLLPPGIDPVVTVRPKQNALVNGTVALPIDLSGELRHSLRAAQAGYRGDEARTWAVTLDQQLLVVRAYFDLLEAIRLREVAFETRDVYRAQLAVARDRYDNGRLTKNDVLTFEVATTNAEQAILQRDLQVERARLVLNDLVGLDVNRRTDPVDVATPPRLDTVEGTLRQAWASNPLLVSLLEDQQRLEETVVALERSRLPRFGAGGAIDWQSTDILLPRAIAAGFVGLTWDLGTDLRRESQVAAARIEAERNRIALERQMRELESAIRTAHLAARERLEAWRAARSAVVQAEENLRIRRQQFDAGRAQSDDVLIAENLLSSQRATLASALYQAHTRRAELQRLVGLPIESE